MRRHVSPVHSPVELGRAVRVRREELAFTYEHVARLIGIDPTVIDRLERGDGAIELQAVILVLQILVLQILVLQLLGLETMVREIYSHQPKDR